MQQKFADYVPIYVKPVEMNVKDTIWSIVKYVRRHVVTVQKNVEEWLPNLFN